MNNLYGFPNLPKAGLGNMLLPWADCLLWCKDFDANMISPFWYKLRIGPIIRNERDKRMYSQCFNSSGQITGLRRLFLLAFSKLESAEKWREGGHRTKIEKKTVVSFSDMNCFHQLVGRQAEVADGLRRIINPEYFPAGLDGKKFVGIHVRLGDYPQQLIHEGSKMVNYRLPLEWYSACLLEIRQALGTEVAAVVFSDGNDNELAPLLNLPHVHRSPFKKAITDMLALSKASIIVTSRSTFSLWGVYLGQVPSIWYPPKKEIFGDELIKNEEGIQSEIEWMIGDSLPDNFIYAVKKRMESIAPS